MKQDALTRDQPILKVGLNLLVSIVLGVIAVILAFFSIFAIREIVIWGMSYLLIRLNPNLKQYQIASVINTTHQIAIFVMGIVALIVAVAVPDYIIRYAGQPRVPRTLIKIVLVESAIVLPVALIFWR